MQPNHGRHRLAILALEGFVSFDLSIPYELFSRTRHSDDSLAYDVFFCGPDRQVHSGALSIGDIFPLSRVAEAKTIIVPGIQGVMEYDQKDVLKALRAASENGCRIASICAGACILAAAGLLQGLTATTHWQLIDELAHQYPGVSVEPDVLFVDNGSILTSAGLSSGIDLCLHLIRKDCGAVAAATVADFFVVPLEREGGQMQRIRRSPAFAQDGLGPFMAWLGENMHRTLDVEEMARQACVSPRTLHRRFKAQTGMSALAWLNAARIRRAQTMLESSALTIEQIATLTGFSNAAALRKRFRASVGTSPLAWRKTYAASI